MDAAFLAHAMVRAPVELLGKLDAGTRRNLADALRSTRSIQPAISNWLLFSAMVEAGLCLMGEPWDRLRVDYAVRQHQQWYKGDGVYGDGPTLHMDYYNSFVIHPMLLDVLRVTSRKTDEWKAIEAEAVIRARRYAAIQERLVSPEGTFPPIGRSLAYRCGAFQLLGQMALRHDLPEGVRPAQVRGAMSAVIRSNDERARHLRLGGMAHGRVRRPPAEDRRELHLVGERVSVRRGVPAARSSGLGSLLDCTVGGVDGEGAVAGGGSSDRPRPRLRAVLRTSGSGDTMGPARAGHALATAAIRM